MTGWDFTRPWYHGSPLRLEVLQVGSTITQDRELARVFSHKPSVVVQEIDDAGKRTIRHTGREPGYLYRITEEVGLEEVYPHPETTMGPGQEWLTRRELRVVLLESTALLEGEFLTPEALAELRAKREQIS